MTTFLSTFPVRQPQGPLQFISYNGPPKQTPRSLPLKKVLSSNDDARGNREELAHAAHGVEIVDLTCSADNEADHEISGSGRESNDVGNRLSRSHPIANSRIDGASDDETSDDGDRADGDRADGDDRSGVAGRDDDWLLPHRERSVNYEQNGYAGEISFETFKSPNQGSTAERSSEDITSSIDEHQVHPMADGGEEGECSSQRANPSAQNMTGDLATMLNKSEVIDLTDLGDENSDDDEGEGEGKCRSPGSRSSSVLQDARYSARPAPTTSQSLSPSSGNIQVEDAVPHDNLLFLMDTGISSSDQSLRKGSSHAIQDSMVEPRQLRRSEPASDQGQYSPLRGSRPEDEQPAAGTKTETRCFGHCCKL
ncbi:hypothetical protein BU23DRAFT_239008 [Bimuria novae-zelandiae CBS 107.79]|uniref:Uncharacterized protein n=1 Tax=Bimuria novae-zelandiae CBS 107.79 TaxID=1447943 RepID=A0A6A5UWR2_9PLEO|nr:hypothetical protein BU23DRAFT_239008 [Bimuria novae-zelandiae CBS 107.79]